LAKYSFLCPNGTIFNQNYFICDWWFNFDCSEAEALYALNDKIAAEREASSGSDAPISSYGAGLKNTAPAPPPVAPVEAEADYEAEEGLPPTPAPAAYGAPAPAGDEETLEDYAPDRQGRAFRRGGRQGRRQQVRGQRPQGRRGRQQFRG